MIDLDYSAILHKLEQGRYLWAVIYYLSGLLIIALPAIVASDILPDRWRRIIALTAAIVASIVTWIQPGTRATAHKRSYLCLRTALVQLDPKSAAFQQKFAECVSLGDYDYADLTPSTSNQGAPK